MHLRDYLMESLQNIRRKKMMTALCIISISVGIASVILISSFGLSTQSAVSQQLDKMGMNAYFISPSDGLSRPVSLTSNDLYKVQQKLNDGEIALPVMIRMTNCYLKNEKRECLTVGSNENLSQVLDIELLHGRTLTPFDISSGAKVAVVDVNTALDIYKRENIVNKKVKILVNGAYETYRIVGVGRSGAQITQTIMSRGTPGFLYVPYTSLAAGEQEQKLDMIAVKSYNVTSEKELETRALSLINTRREKYFKWQSMASGKDQLTSVIGMVALFISAVAGISLLVGAIGIMVIMLSAVNDRTREIGIKKALGATQRNILIEFLIETGLLCLLGCLIGTAAAAGLSILTMRLIGIPVLFDFRAIFLSCVLLISLGILSGIYPARLAARLNPVDIVSQ